MQGLLVFGYICRDIGQKDFKIDLDNRGVDNEVIFNGSRPWRWCESWMHPPRNRHSIVDDSLIWRKQLNAENSMMAACRNKATKCGNDAWKASWMAAEWGMRS